MPQVRYQLTLGQLAEFDDLLTDALVDRVYYWTTIRKMKHLYHPNRGVKTDAVVRIIVDDVVRNKSVPTAMKNFLELAGIQSFLRKLGKNENLKNDFVKHARRYLSIYLPDAPFEVSATNRYTLSGLEACILARKEINKGDTVKYLTGAMAKMTPEEEAEYTAGKTDFSIIYSSRVGGMSLLLGPARFVNHDCKPNAKFITSVKDNIQLTVLRDIKVGEEITVKYADDYFGEGNRECLCRTCEKLVRNGWAPDGEGGNGGGGKKVAEDPAEDEGSDGIEMMRTRSKRKSVGRDTAEPTPPPSKKTKRKPTKLDILTPPDSDRSNSEEGGAPPNTGPTSQDTVMQQAPPLGTAAGPVSHPSSGVEATAPATITPVTRESTPVGRNGHLLRHHTPLPLRIDDAKQLDAADALLTLHRSPTAYNPLGSPIFQSHQRVRSFDRSATGQFGGPLRARSSSLVDTPMSGSPLRPYPAHRIPETVPNNVQLPSPVVPVQHLESASAPPAVKTEPVDPPTDVSMKDPTPEATQESTKKEESDLSDADVDKKSDTTEKAKEEPKDEKEEIIVPPPRKSHKKVAHPSTVKHIRRRSLPGGNAGVTYEIIRRRVPGDYLTFYDNDSIKIVCQDCKEEFIHSDRWYIPRACKRCERHSKIYGLIWPKTIKRKGDDEERVEDPRMVKRYVTAGEWRREVKRAEELKKAEAEKTQKAKGGRKAAGGAKGGNKRKAS